jgi:hypothetical protein
LYSRDTVTDNRGIVNNQQSHGHGRSQAATWN